MELFIPVYKWVKTNLRNSHGLFCTGTQYKLELSWNFETVREKSGNFVVLKCWEPCKTALTQTTTLMSVNKTLSQVYQLCSSVDCIPQLCPSVNLFILVRIFLKQNACIIILHLIGYYKGQNHILLKIRGRQDLTKKYVNILKYLFLNFK